MGAYLRNLFGEEEPCLGKKIVLREVVTKFKRWVVREDAPEWVNHRFTSAAQIYEMFRGELCDEPVEHMMALLLDGKNRIVAVKCISQGSLNQSLVHPREVFADAVALRAAAVIMVHNHPTGDPTPSSEDLAVTRRLVEAGEVVGIRLLDHVVIGNNEAFYSFAENGLL